MSGQLKEVRTRIKSVGTTQQITKAMKMVSAAKLRRAQDAITQMRPYAEKLQEMLGNIIGSVDGNIGGGLNVERPIEKVLIIVVTSDRGLCGAFNANSVKLAKQVIKERYNTQFEKGQVTILPLGKKGYESFARQNFPMIDQFWNVFGNLNFDQIKGVAEHVRKAFINKEFDRVDLIYSKFRNAATQEFVCEQHLPIIKTKTSSKNNLDFIFEPSKEVLIQELMPKILNTQLFKGTLDSNASEHGARMTAMDKATENAEEMLKTLKISYNRARQAAITTELTEIVSGAAALNG
jgi:F-type H+-transporting ATPase subunit gamma